MAFDSGGVFGYLSPSTNFIVNNPTLWEQLPDRNFYKQFIKKVKGKDVPDVDEIGKFWEQTYKKFQVIGEKNAGRLTLEIVKTPETEYDYGDPAKKKTLTNWWQE